MAVPPTTPTPGTPCRPYRVEALKPEAVGSSTFAAVHVVPEGQDDLQGHHGLGTQCQEGAVPTDTLPALGAHPLGLPHPKALTSRMWRSLLEDLRDMEAAMMALSCCGREGRV